ncbi:MAG: transcription-repair coupling factor [Erysipelotrichaceae bacterium]|nr:transcription-repair coupling factor [Erysipelotrichaceae bacterium]
MEKWLEALQKDAAAVALGQKEKNIVLNPLDGPLILAASYLEKPRNMVVVSNNLYSAQQLYQRLIPLVNDEVLLFAVEESLRVEAIAASPTIYVSQMETLNRILMDGRPHLIITHPMGMMRYLPEREIFRSHMIRLKAGDVISMNDLRRKLVENGYHYSQQVDKPLSFSIRGSIIDVFSVQDEMPLRIEFFDDEIDSLRYFDSSTQRTVANVKEALIVPASTLIYDEDFSEVEKKIRRQYENDYDKCSSQQQLEENINQDIEFLSQRYFEYRLYRYYCFFEKTTTLLGYVDDPEVILLDPSAINDNIEYVTNDSAEYILEQFQSGEALNYYSLFEDFDRLLRNNRPLRINDCLDYFQAITSRVTDCTFPLTTLSSAIGEINKIAMTREVHLLVDENQRRIIANAYQELGVKIPESVIFETRALTEGFEYENMVIITARELFGRVRFAAAYENKFNAAQQLDDYQQLKPGDYVVHSKYGIGQYMGIETREIKKIHKDYLKVMYRDGGTLLVPLEQFRLVRKYVSSEGVGVRLSKLGSTAWSKAKEKIQKDVEDIARRLLTLYVARETESGFAFSPDDRNMEQFEANVTFERTDDQLRAIKEIKEDMEKPVPMDRLLCGDVGFGKTEVAMVAAFKAVNDGKQVAYLCPTTILSRQHYNTFIERFKGFPVKIGLLNRFVDEKKQKEVLKGVRNGDIDILIGTHRILSNDVSFYDLGLLIVDEEQRFGVQAKEKIKELKHSIDFLSLSATPIPRTLQMSLVGVMSLSQLDEAPQNRNPIQTYVVEKNEKLIKEVIERELARKGQVFYLHNQIDTIYATARNIEEMIPDARIAVAHGKMAREEIEDVMYQFVAGEYDILVCTTIIETGLDIPNANTVIIENADRFGLAQLYQIRGRVGRSERIAYAYLMYEKHRQLSETASKRLKAIKDFTELGSGYKIAMRDLTIRGAGDLLGERQAGFIDAVGMDLYIEMLQNAIRKEKGIEEEIVEQKGPEIQNADGYIPQEFSDEDYEKITLYQRIDACGNVRSLQQLQQEIVDRYGKLPQSVNLLFEKKQAELMLTNVNIARFDELEKECRIVLSRTFSAQVDGVQLFGRVMDLSNSNELKYINKQIIIIIPKRRNWLNMVNKIVEIIEEIGEGQKDALRQIS